MYVRAVRRGLEVMVQFSESLGYKQQQKKKPPLWSEMKLNTRNDLQTDVKGCQARESALKGNEKKQAENEN